MSYKCKWEYGKFLPCDKMEMAKGSDYFERDVYVRYDYCPFCGADIRKPKPKQPSREDILKVVDFISSDQYVPTSIKIHASEIYKFMKRTAEVGS